MIIRYQMGPFPHERSWKSLGLSISLMKHLEPNAEFHVTVQTSPELQKAKYELDGVMYHYQDRSEYPIGRHKPPRFNRDVHEVWMDNDHIMWRLPSGWETFRRRRNAVLIWRTDWDYYGPYSYPIGQKSAGFHASAGMWGIPPLMDWEVPVLNSPPQTRNQEEMGWVVYKLLSHPHHEYIYESSEITAFNPSHPVLGNRKNKIGTHGVHLMGMNRGFNPAADEVLEWVQETKIGGCTMQPPVGVTVL